jgi:DNA-binding NarL/FixJ family response regulator
MLSDDPRPLRVLIAEDEVLLSAAIARLLVEAGMEVVAEVTVACAILPAVADHRPDVAICDVQMPPRGDDDGLEAAIAVRHAFPQTAVLMLSHFLEERYPMELIGEDATGVGYLLKARIADVPSFVDAVRRVAAGGAALDPQVVARMVGRQRRDNPIDELSPRERDVLELMGQGRSNHGIAQALGVTPGAVEKHVTNLFAKLGLHQEPRHHRRVMAVLTLLQDS